MIKIISKFILTLAISAILGATSANAGYATGLIVSYAESPGSMNSSLTGTSVLNFDSLPLGLNTGVTWTGVGTIDKVYTLTADAYGGAGGSHYPVQSADNSLGNIPVTTLSLNTKSGYFGLWWSAGDAHNSLDFYNGASLVASFVTADLGTLPSTYKGNPNSGHLGQNSSEYYTFLNFYGNGVLWDKIVFSNNNGTSGFESDNWTSRVAPWGSGPGESGPVPGVPVVVINGNTVTSVPEPGNFTSTLLIGLVGSLSAGVMALRRSKSQIKA